jgi:ATP-dependent helicase HepA
MFCTVKGLEALGTAKLLESGERESVVEYFDSPGVAGRPTRTVPTERVAPKNLGTNTRTYYQEPSTGRWFVGRIIEADETSALVRFTHKTDLALSHTNLYVRWRQPIADPAVFLAHLITETPQYADARSGFLRSYIAQRAAAGGVSALLSSTVELERHQIDVVQRVLSDTHQRYLLADEVGLGKTIEAGVIIRQAVLDDPRAHRIIILAPSSLTHQWRDELTNRFGLRDLIDDSVQILSFESPPALEAALHGATMLVVDEAHHLSASKDASAAAIYEVLRRLAKHIDRLLLLSATPALRNETGFLRLLHLLDPYTYRLEDEAAFRHRIAHRQSLAEAVATLDPQNVLSLDLVLDDLRSMLPLDARLHELLDELKAHLSSLPEPEDPELELSILKLRTHLSETYRLHRRVLRNRRKRVPFLTPRRNGAEVWMVAGNHTAGVETLLEAWRMRASAACQDDERLHALISPFYIEMIRALLEHNKSVADLCAKQERIHQSDNVQGCFPEEKQLLQRMQDAYSDEEAFEARLQRLRQGLATLSNDSTKIVIFSANEATADAIFEHLRTDRALTVARHSAEPESEHRWQRFLSDSKVRTIVCGPSAEEGLNLQGGEKVIIHFDLPLSPNRIEQRMGRVDRYGTGSPIRSIILLDEGSTLQHHWWTLLDAGLSVFNRSIATLQYLIEEELRRLLDGVMVAGIEALAELTQSLAGPMGKVAHELRLLDQQDALDELNTERDAEIGAVEEIDGQWKQTRSQLMYWIVDTLLFEKILERDVSGPKAQDPPFRLQYGTPNSMGPATLIPMSGFTLDFIGALDLEAPGGSSAQPRTHRYSLHRKTAINRGARVLRYGDGFVEALKTFTDVDDRGRSFALWRHHAGRTAQTPDALYFRFDFLIEADLSEADVLLEQPGMHTSDAARAAMKRRGDTLLSPQVMTLWLTEDGERADPALVETILSLPYLRETIDNSYVDTNLNAERLLHLTKSLPDLFQAWPQRCDGLRRRALELLHADTDLLSKKEHAIRQARRHSGIRLAQLSARTQSLSGSEAMTEQRHLELERALSEALLHGIDRPLIRLDVMGFIILSAQPFPQ